MNKLLVVLLISVPLMANAGNGNGNNGHHQGGGNSGQGQGNGGGNNGNGGIPPQPPTPPNPPVTPPVVPPVVPPTVPPTGPENVSEVKNKPSKTIPDNISDPTRQLGEVYYEQSIVCVYSPNGVAKSIEACYNYLNRQVEEVLSHE